MKSQQEIIQKLSELAYVNTDIIRYIYGVNIQIFIETLKINTRLETLDLEYSNVDNNDIKTIAKALKISVTLKSLNLSNNYIDINGAKKIAEALKINKVLKSLNLSDNNIGNNGAKAIAKALMVNTILESLDLYNNNIGNNGAKAIAEALMVNTILENLDLSGNKISDDGAKVLAEALRYNISCKLNLSPKELKKFNEFNELNERNYEIRNILNNFLGYNNKTQSEYTLVLQKIIKGEIKYTKTADNIQHYGEHRMSELLLSLFRICMNIYDDSFNQDQLPSKQYTKIDGYIKIEKARISLDDIAPFGDVIISYKSLMLRDLHQVVKVFNTQHQQSQWQTYQICQKIIDLSHIGLPNDIKSIANKYIQQTFMQQNHDYDVIGDVQQVY